MKDLGGAERQRIFWRQNYFGTQGVLFVIDASDNQTLDQSLQELEKIITDPELDENVPIAVFMNKGNLETAENLVRVNKAIVNLRVYLCKICQIRIREKEITLSMLI